MKQPVLYFLMFLLFSVNISFSQRVADSVSTGKIIRVIKADKYNFQDKDTLGKFISLVGNAEVQQEKILFFGDSIVINQKENILEAFGNIHINDADSVQVYSQYLKYLGKEKKSFLQQKVKLTDGKGVLTTNELEYDTQFKIGKYFKGGKVVNKKTVLTSVEGVYYGDTRDVYFTKNVILIDPQYKITTDSMLYNINTEITNIVAPSIITSGKRIIKTKDGYYDVKNKKGSFFQRPFIDDSTYTFTADQMAFDDSTGYGEAQGNAVYRGKDSTGGYDIIANNIKTNKKKNSFLATQKPILFLKQDKDTIYISADTLYAGKVSDLKKTRIVPVVRDTMKIYTGLHDSSTLYAGKIVDPKKIKTVPVIKDSLKKDTSLQVSSLPKSSLQDSGLHVAKKKMNEPVDSTTDRFFEAYHHVKIFSDSLQALGDSLFYSLEDSTFRLFRDPVAWTQENQITGDTIYMFLENKKPQRLYVFENAMAISKESKDYFNQVRGTTMNAYFKNGKIHYMRTKGSPADNVYYAVDDNKKFVGVNRSTSSLIEVYFEDGKPQKVVFVNNLNGTMYPMRQVNHDDIKVRKFKWLEDKRPKTKLDILAN
ncbi:MAG TPA: OstA-like protein [Chitinophagaceae bacterium]|nr:OstA-like protein [Chitinophagaceae bacterium]